jgi:hypothetical protein
MRTEFAHKLNIKHVVHNLVFCLSVGRNLHGLIIVAVGPHAFRHLGKVFQVVFELNDSPCGLSHATPSGERSLRRDGYSRLASIISSGPFSSGSRKRFGMPDKPTCAPTRAPVRILRAWFCPPPFNAFSTACSKSSRNRAAR